MNSREKHEINKKNIHSFKNTASSQILYGKGTNRKFKILNKKNEPSKPAVCFLHLVN